MLVAGRCISTSHVAQASTRVIAPALALGEAAGTLAAKSAGSKMHVRDVPAKVVQTALRQHGAVLEA